MISKIVIDSIASIFHSIEYIKIVGNTGRMDTFCVSSRDRKYFVKSIINSDIQRIKYQNEIISFIQSKRIKTAEQCKIHKSKNGNLFAVRPWIDGTTIDVFDKSSIVKISEIISIMHSYKINGINLWHYNNLENLSNPKWLFIKYQIYRTGIDQLRTFFSAAFSAIEKNHETICVDLAKLSLVHGDIKQANTIVKGNDILIIDWDFSGVGSAILDFALTNLHFCFGSSEFYYSWYDNELVNLYFDDAKYFSIEVFEKAQIIAGLGYFLQDIAMFIYSHTEVTDIEKTGREKYFKEWCLPEYERFYFSCDIKELNHNSVLDPNCWKKDLFNLLHISPG